MITCVRGGDGNALKNAFFRDEPLGSPPFTAVREWSEKLFPVASPMGSFHSSFHSFPLMLPSFLFPHCHHLPSLEIPHHTLFSLRGSAFVPFFCVPCKDGPFPLPWVLGMESLLKFSLRDLLPFRDMKFFVQVASMLRIDPDHSASPFRLGRVFIRVKRCS